MWASFRSSTKVRGCRKSQRGPKDWAACNVCRKCDHNNSCYCVHICFFLLLQTPTNLRYLPFSTLHHSLLRHILVCKNEPEVDWFRHLMLPTPLYLPRMQERDRCGFFRHLMPPSPLHLPMRKTEPEVDYFRHSMPLTPLHLPRTQEQDRGGFFFSTSNAANASPPP